MYDREYREWIAKGSFASLHARVSESMDAAIQAKRPELVASALDDLAVCFHYRGAVALLEGNRAGWRDVQCGYLANVYALRFRLPLMTPFATTHRENPDFLVRTTVVLGLAQLFGVAYDERLIRDWLSPRFSLDKLVGDVPIGGRILATLFAPEVDVSADELRQDRIACAKAREAWPKRATEIAPLGVLDVEMSLAHSGAARFPYEDVEYAPTEDDAVIRGMSAFHEWNV